MTLASTIAVSGLHAAALRLQTSALNIANSLSDSPLPGTTRAGGANEFTQLLIARYTFAANALVIRADAEMRSHSSTSQLELFF